MISISLDGYKEEFLKKTLGNNIQQPWRDDK
jgi:hypothetical protein